MTSNDNQITHHQVFDELAVTENNSELTALLEYLQNLPQESFRSENHFWDTLFKIFQFSEHRTGAWVGSILYQFPERIHYARDLSSIASKKEIRFLKHYFRQQMLNCRDNQSRFFRLCVSVVGAGFFYFFVIEAYKPSLDPTFYAVSEGAILVGLGALWINAALWLKSQFRAFNIFAYCAFLLELAESSPSPD